MLAIMMASPAAAAGIKDIEVKIGRSYSVLKVPRLVITVANSSERHLKSVIIECGFRDEYGEPHSTSTKTVADIPANTEVIDEVLSTSDHVFMAECRPTTPRFE